MNKLHLQEIYSIGKGMQLNEMKCASTMSVAHAHAIALHRSFTRQVLKVRARRLSSQTRIQEGAEQQEVEAGISREMFAAIVLFSN